MKQTQDKLWAISDDVLERTAQEATTIVAKYNAKSLSDEMNNSSELSKPLAAKKMEFLAIKASVLLVARRDERLNYQQYKAA